MIDFADLARPTGFSGSLKEVVDGQRRRLTADFIACARLLREESPELINRTGFSEYFRQLSHLSGPTLTWLFHLPTTAFWTDVMRQLIMRRSHKLMPTGHPSAHLREFGRFVLAAYVYEGLSGHVNIRLDRNSRLYLPGLRGVWLCPKDLSFTDLLARVDHETLTLSAPDGRRAVLDRSQILVAARERRTAALRRLADGFRYRVLPLSCELFEVSNGDPYLRLPERVSYNFETLTRPAEDRWVLSIERAWDMIVEADPLVADEIANVIDVMVPVVSDVVDVHLSSSFPELFGGFYLSWSSQAQTLAEAIVHEYHHVKLNAILENDPIIIGGTEEAIFYSPWRDDPRPLSGLLHAVYAFAGVTRFWLAHLKCIAHASEPSETERIGAMIAKSVSQLEHAIDSLQQHTAFTEAGRRLVDALANDIGRMQAEQPRLLPRAEAVVHESVRSHFEQWHQRYKVVITPTLANHDASESPSAGLPDEDWVIGCVALNVPNEPAEAVPTDGDSRIIEVANKVLGYDTRFSVNRIEEGVHHKDPLMDDLFTLNQDNKHAYDALREITFASVRIKSPLGTFMRSLFNYTEGDYHESAVGLLDVISVYPNNVDAWKYFALALRHCGYDGASRAILFNLPSCITHTQQNLIKRKLTTYEGLQCNECGSPIVGVPTQARCLRCGGASFDKTRVTAPVSFHRGLAHTATELERLSQHPQSNSSR